jgi:hypothetical protein
MITYYISGSNQIGFRYKQPLSSGSLALSLMDMSTFVSTSINLSTSSFTNERDQQLIYFNFPQISGSKTGDEYKLNVWDTTGSVSTLQFKGTIQCYESQSAPYFVSQSQKVDYTTQNNTSLSYTSSNEYIIL